jgi:hypothetical protein
MIAQSSLVMVRFRKNQILAFGIMISLSLSISPLDEASSFPRNPEFPAVDGFPLALSSPLERTPSRALRFELYGLTRALTLRRVFLNCVVSLSLRGVEGTMPCEKSGVEFIVMVVDPVKALSV